MMTQIGMQTLIEPICGDILHANDKPTQETYRTTHHIAAGKLLLPNVFILRQTRRNRRSVAGYTRNRDGKAYKPPHHAVIYGTAGGAI
jgi:hypothetical protein